jgi:hypothetical protein
MGDGHPGQKLQSLVIINSALHDYATMAVVSIFAQAHIGYDQEIWCRLFNDTDCFLNYAVISIGLGSTCVFVVRETKEEHSRNAELRDLGDFLRQSVQRQVEYAWHWLHGFTDILAVCNKQGIYEILDGQ